MSVLDIATGSGDVPIQLCRYAAATGITLEVGACDLSDRALAFAARSLPEDTSIQLFTLDIISDPIPRQYGAGTAVVRHCHAFASRGD